MRPAYGAYEFEGRTGGRFRLYAPAQNEPLRERFASFCRRSTRPAAPLEVREYENVVLADSPTGVCLYDADGQRIEASCLARYSDELEPELWRAAEALDGRPIRGEIETPVVFQSVFIRHWGHFLLESMGRAWACAVDPRLADLESVFAWSLGSGPPPPTFRDFIDAAGLRLAPREGEPRKLRLSKCFVPTASFATVGYSDPLHLAAPHRAARRLLRSEARDPRPVYFSRLNFRPYAEPRPTIRNEADLEDGLAARGARVVHMETLSLAEQIEVMNAHSVFIGPWGSALHNTVFSLRGPEISTFVLLGRFLPTNYMLVDTIVGNTAHYLTVLTRSEDFDASRQLVLDVEATLEYLERQGVFA